MNIQQINCLKNRGLFLLKIKDIRLRNIVILCLNKNL